MKCQSPDCSKPSADFSVYCRWHRYVMYALDQQRPPAPLNTPSVKGPHSKEPGEKGGAVMKIWIGVALAVFVYMQVMSVVRLWAFLGGNPKLWVSFWGIAAEQLWLLAVGLYCGWRAAGRGERQ
jgi:hypothetical protein